MELGGGRGRRGRLAAAAATATAPILLVVCFYCCCCCCFSACGLVVNTGRTSAHLATGISACDRGKDSPMQGVPTAAEGSDGKATGEAEVWRRRTTAVAMRRYLVGPGSYPPRCTSKCGDCSPCKPVHVPVPPGTPVITEYYPEAWRCKCGGKLYMP